MVQIQFNTIYLTNITITNEFFLFIEQQKIVSVLQEEQKKMRTYDQFDTNANRKKRSRHHNYEHSNFIAAKPIKQPP